MNRSDIAVACFREGFTCSQAVLTAFADECGLDRKTAMRIALGFGGGMGRMALTCGAVTGAIMVIGLKKARIVGPDEESKQRTYGLVRELRRRFESRNGSILCRELLGCDVGTPEGFEQAKLKGLLVTRCPKFVADSVEILEEIT